VIAVEDFLGALVDIESFSGYSLWQVIFG